MSAKGRTLRSQSQQLVVNLLNYFQREKENGGNLLPLSAVQEVKRIIVFKNWCYFNDWFVFQRVADALGLSISTVKRVKSRSIVNPILTSPGKKRPRKKVKSEDLPDTSKMHIRNTLYTMYANSKFYQCYDSLDALDNYVIYFYRKTCHHWFIEQRDSWRPHFNK